MKQKMIISAFTFLAISAMLLPQEPFGQTHQQYIPFFLDTYDFQTIRTGVFQGKFSGMVPDPFSDLGWHPAFISQSVKNSFYIDLQSQRNPQFPNPPNAFAQQNIYDSLLIQ